MIKSTADLIEAFVEADAKYIAEHKADHESVACESAYSRRCDLEDKAEEALMEMLEDEPLVLLRALRLAQDDTSGRAAAMFREHVRDLRHGVDRIISLIHNLPRSATADEIDRLAIDLLNRTASADTTNTGDKSCTP